MKTIAITTALAVFFLLIFIYATYSLPVFDWDKLRQIATDNSILTNDQLISKLSLYIQSGLIWSVLDMRNFVIWLVLLAGTLISGITAAHLSIDKLFYRKFFEKPSLFSAVRRAVLVYLTILAVIMLRLLDGLFWYNLVSLFILVLAIELLTMSFVGTRLGKKQQEMKKNTSGPV